MGNTPEIVIFTKPGYHLLIDNFPIGHRIGNHPFQTISHRNVNLAALFPAFRLNQHNHSVVFTFAAHSPRLSDLIGKTGRIVSPEGSDGNHRDLGAGFPVELNQPAFKFLHLLRRQNTGQIIHKPGRFGPLRNLGQAYQGHEKHHPKPIS